MAQHVGENVQLEVSALSSTQLLAWNLPFCCCRAICTAERQFKVGMLLDIYNWRESREERTFKESKTIFEAQGKWSAISTLWPDATARSSPSAWKAMEAMGRSMKEKTSSNQNHHMVNNKLRFFFF